MAQPVLLHIEMENMKTPPEISFQGNIAEKWKRWKQRFEFYMCASGGAEKPMVTKIAVLLHVIGPEALDKNHIFSLTTEQRRDYNTIIKAFEEYIVPKSNKTIDRHLFFTSDQQEGEAFNTYLTELLNDSLAGTNSSGGEPRESQVLPFAERTARAHGLGMDNCDCGKEYKLKSSLAIHTNECGKRDRSKCQFCSMAFSSFASVRQPESRAHKVEYR